MAARSLCAGVVVCLLASVASAQAPPPLVITAMDRIEWASPSGITTVSAAQLLEYRARVDQAAEYVVLTEVACVPALEQDRPAAATCSTKVPQVLLPVVNSYGQHKLTLTAFSGTADEESSPSLPFRVAGASGCTDGTTAYPRGAMIGQRNQLSTQNMATRVGEMRARGWFVEWFRVQFSLDTTAGSGYFYLIGECRGF